MTPCTTCLGSVRLGAYRTRMDCREGERRLYTQEKIRANLARKALTVSSTSSIVMKVGVDFYYECAMNVRIDNALKPSHKHAIVTACLQCIEVATQRTQTCHNGCNPCAQSMHTHACTFCGR